MPSQLFELYQSEIFEINKNLLGRNSFLFFTVPCSMRKLYNYMQKHQNSADLYSVFCFHFPCHLGRHVLLWSAARPWMWCTSVCPNNDMADTFHFKCKQRQGCQSLGFLMCAHMLMSELQTRGLHKHCKSLRRKRILKADSGRKIPCCTGELSPCKRHARPGAQPNELFPHPLPASTEHTIF